MSIPKTLPFQEYDGQELERKLGLAKDEGWDELVIVQAEKMNSVKSRNSFIEQMRTIGFLINKEQVVAIQGHFDLGFLEGFRSLKKLGIEKCQIVGKMSDIEEELSSLTHLMLFETFIRDEATKSLAKISTLRSLSLNQNSISCEGATNFASLKNLTSLNLDSNDIGDKGAKALAKLTKLTSLNLSFNRIRNEGTKALAELTNLTSLNLEVNHIGDEGARALAALTNLTSLNLSFNRIRNEGTKALAELTNLTSLNLNVNHIGAEGAKALAELTNLTSLYLVSNDIGEKGAKALAELTNLTALNLDSNDIGDKGAKALAELTNLTALNLDSNDIGDKGAKALAKLTKLTSLNLNFNRIGSEGARVLAAFANLTSLNLYSNNIGDEGLDELLNNFSPGNMPNLKRLDLKKNQIKNIDSSVLDTMNPFLITSASEGKPIYESRVMFVGMGEVGKTSLVKRVFEDKYTSKNELTENTVAFELVPIKKSGFRPKAKVAKSGNLIEVIPRIWDFAGQVITHGVHEAFLEDDGRTIYILVLAANRIPERKLDRFEDVGNGFAYWLKSIVHFKAQKAPIVVAINKCEEFESGEIRQIDVLIRHPQLNSEKASDDEMLPASNKALSKEAVLISPDAYENANSDFRVEHTKLLNDIFSTNIKEVVDGCTSRKGPFSSNLIQTGIDRLRYAIESSLEDPNINLQGSFPKSFPDLRLKVDEALKTRAFIELKEYHQWCIELKIPQVKTHIDLLTILHSLGSASYFGSSNRMQFSRDQKPSEILSDRLFNPFWIKQIAYQLVCESTLKFSMTLDDVRRQIQKANHKLFTHPSNSKKNTFEETHIIQEFLKWTGLCFEYQSELIFPRGYKTERPSRINKWPMASVQWSFLPEHAFHRLVVSMLTRGEIEQDNGNWQLFRFAAQFKIAGASGFVIIVPEDGIMEFLFDPESDKERWKTAYEILTDAMATFLKETPKPLKKLNWSDLIPKNDEQRHLVPSPTETAIASSPNSSVYDVIKAQIPLNAEDEQRVDAIIIHLDNYQVDLRDAEVALLRRLFQQSDLRFNKPQHKFNFRLLMFRELLLTLKEDSPKLKASCIFQWPELIEFLYGNMLPTHLSDEDHGDSELGLESYRVMQMFGHAGLPEVEPYTDPKMMLQSLIKAGDTQRKRCTAAGKKCVAAGTEWVYSDNYACDFIDELRRMMRMKPIVGYTLR